MKVGLQLYQSVLSKSTVGSSSQKGSIMLSKYARLAPTQWEQFMIPMSEDGKLLNSDGYRTTPGLSQDVADGSIFFDRQLEHIDARMFEVKFPELKIRQFIPIKNDAGWASFEVYQILEKYGVPERIADYGNDLPSAESQGREVSKRIFDWGVKYHYNFREFSRARELGIDLDAAKGVTAFKSMERKLDEIGGLGDTESGVEGLISHSLVTPANVVNGAGGTPAWTTKTSAEIIFDVNDIIADMRSNSSEVFNCNQLLLPTAQYDYIKGLQRASGTDTTVLEYLRRVHPEVSFESWHRLDGQGAGATQRMIAMDRNPENAELSIPIETMRLDPQFRALVTEIPLIMAIGGVLLRQPLSFIYRDAI
jgi:hypothetical protein